MGKGDRGAGARRRRRQVWITTVAAIALYLALTVNWLLGAPACHGCRFLRTSSPLADGIVIALTQLVPGAALIFVLLRGRGAARWVSALLLLPLVLLSAPIGLIAGEDLDARLRYGSSPAVELLQRVEAGPVAFSLFRTNFGAAAGFGMLLRRERRVLPGLLWVRNVHGWYHVDEGSLSVASGGMLRVQVAGGGLSLPLR